jgi:hypothetical protein
LSWDDLDTFALPPRLSLAEDCSRTSDAKDLLRRSVLTPALPAVIQTRSLSAEIPSGLGLPLALGIYASVKKCIKSMVQKLDAMTMLPNLVRRFEIIKEVVDI